MSVSTRVLVSIGIACSVVPLAAQSIVLQSSVVASGGSSHVRDATTNHGFSCTIGQSVVSNKAESEGIDRHEGFWVPWPSSIVSVDEIEPAAPLHAYPNPFAVSTRIEIGEEFASEVEVSLYTLAGLRIRTIAVESLAAGSGSVELTSVDEYNQPLASGQYICSVTGRTHSGARMRAYTTVTVLK
jgi:hypothetical protein